MGKRLGTIELPGDNHCSRREYLLRYTLCFLVTALAVLSWFYLSGRTLIWEDDGWKQHYKALLYYGRYLRRILLTLVQEHRLVIPAWDYNLGEGNDILATLHYYVMGDPLCLGAVLVPTRWMYLYYGGCVVLRMYLAGLAFSWLCSVTGHRSVYGRLAGSITYAFCFWALLSVCRHPFFLGPMIYFPLLLAGVELILEGRKPWAFLLSVTLAAVSNFYFFYMLAILTAVYSLIRLVGTWRRDLRGLGRRLAVLLSSALLGVGLGAIVLLPVCAAFLSDTRMSGAPAWHLFYPLSYYFGLPARFLSTGETTNWLYISISGTAIPALFLLIRKKGRGTLKLLLSLCVLIMLLPALGRALNGFTYISNRWSWAFVLLMAYIYTVMWPDLMNLSGKDILALGGCLGGYLGLCLLLEQSRQTEVFMALGLALLVLIVVAPVLNENGSPVVGLRARQRTVLALTLAGIFCSACFLYAPSNGDYASEAVEAEKVVSGIFENETEAVRRVAAQEGAEGFWRYSGLSPEINANMLSEMSSVQYYWTNANPAVAEYRQALGMLEVSLFNYKGYDGRAGLLALSGVRYFTAPASDNWENPYGFRYVGRCDVRSEETQEAAESMMAELGTQELTPAQQEKLEALTRKQYDVYESDSALPLAYGYTQYLTRADWDGLGSVDKEQAMLQAVVLEEAAPELDHVRYSSSSREIPFEITCGSAEITALDGAFVVTAPYASVTLSLQGLPDSETYLEVSGLQFSGDAGYDQYFGETLYDPQDLYNRTLWSLLSQKDRTALRREKRFWSQPRTASISMLASTGAIKTLDYWTPEDRQYNGRHDFTANLRYAEEPVTSITLTFSDRGIYTYDSLRVICQPMENFVSQVDALAETTFDQLTVDTDRVEGTVQVEEPTLLCVSIPWSTGWEATVDGVPATLYRANVKNMGVLLESGTHSVVLRYHTPLLKVGALITLGCLFLLTALVFWQNWRPRSRNKEA